jgi:glycine cleavage system H protein
MTETLKLTGDIEYEFPLDRFYWTEDPGHTWALPQDDGTFKIGVDSWTVIQAGKILSIRTRKVGSTVKQGKTLATIETGKWIGVIKSPFSAKIIEIYEPLNDNPAILNEKPYETWIVVIEPTNLDEELNAEKLIKIGDKEALTQYIEAEFKRFL